MKEPILLIMAAGMGSRYGGLKQIDPVGDNGELIIDYSLFDAKRAGFKRVIFIIQEKHQNIFDELVARGSARDLDVQFVYQDITKLPQGCALPEGRKKPWGTGHAVMMAEKCIDAPFAVINADDFYGRDAFAKLYQFLCTLKDCQRSTFAMVGFLLKNTVTRHGNVSRGVCEVKNDKLIGIVERTKIALVEDKIQYADESCDFWTALDPNAVVSMNFWGFTPSIFSALHERFMNFYQKDALKHPLTAEFYLPAVVNYLIEEDLAEVSVLSSIDKWYGVTYKEDKPEVVAAIRQMVESKRYPSSLCKPVI